MYVNGGDRYNVRIGTKYGNSQFFLINSVNGAPTVPGYNVKNGDCYATVENSTEGEYIVGAFEVTKQFQYTRGGKQLRHFSVFCCEVEMPLFEGHTDSSGFSGKFHWYDRIMNRFFFSSL